METIIVPQPCDCEMSSQHLFPLCKSFCSSSCFDLTLWGKEEKTERKNLLGPKMLQCGLKIRFLRDHVNSGRGRNFVTGTQLPFPGLGADSTLAGRDQVFLWNLSSCLNTCGWIGPQNTTPAANERNSAPCGLSGMHHSAQTS